MDRGNLTLHTRLKQPNREMNRYLKSKVIHDKVIGTFIAV
ncbi:IS1 family transposase [Candidatus Enterovibrio altilux]